MLIYKEFKRGIFARNGYFDVNKSKFHIEYKIWFFLRCFKDDGKIVFILIKLGIYTIFYFVLYPLFYGINQETTLQNAPDGDGDTTARGWRTCADDWSLQATKGTGNE